MRKLSKISVASSLARNSIVGGAGIFLRQPSVNGEHPSKIELDEKVITVEVAYSYIFSADGKSLISQQ